MAKRKRKINLIFKEAEPPVDQDRLRGLSDLPVDQRVTRASASLYIHFTWSEEEDERLRDLFPVGARNYIRVSPDEDEVTLSIEVEPDPDISSSRLIKDVSLIFPEARRNLLALKPLETEEKGKPALANTEAVLGRLTTYLGKKVDTIETLLNKAETYYCQKQYSREQDSLIEAAKLACTTLEQVSENDYLREAVRLLAKERNRHAKGFEDVMMSLKKVEKFLEKEYKLLIRSGMSPNSAKEVITECFDLLTAVYEGEVPPYRMFEAIARIRAVTCELKDELLEHTLSAARREQVKKGLRKARIVIAGTSLVVLNASTYLVDFLTPTEAAVSLAFGEGLIGAAISGLWI